jgi:hypothetical protein
VVSKAKATARVDQETLKRSISYTYVRGVVTFSQMYYGIYGTNSQLEKLARKYMPSGVQYRIELLDLDGGVFEVSRVKRGNASVKSMIASVVRNNSPKIRAMIAKALLKKKNNGEA